MKNPLFAAILCLSTGISFGAARADEGSSGPSPSAPVTAHLVGGNTGVIVGGVSDQPYAFGGVALDGGVILGLGVGFAYDGTAAKDKTSALGIVHGSYMLTNSAKFAAGPELFVIMPFAPTAASTVTFRPGFALWYAPFSAPVLFGTAVDLDVIYVKDPNKVQLKLATPGLRIGYAF